MTAPTKPIETDEQGRPLTYWGGKDTKPSEKLTETQRTHFADDATLTYIITLERDLKAAEQRAEAFRKERDKSNEGLSAANMVVRALLESLTHPTPPTATQWVAIRAIAKSYVAAIDAALAEGEKK